MKLLSAKPMDGARWMMSGVRLLFKFPLAHLACVSVMSFGLGALLALPWVGPVLMLTLLPGLTAGWVECATAPRLGLVPSPMRLLAPLLSKRRGVLLRLGLTYAACALLMMWLADSLDPDFRTQWAAMVASDADADKAMEVVAAVQQGALLRGLFFLPVALLFWHAPVVVARGESGVAQALFTSGVATLRNLGAFLVYGATWLLADVLVSTLAGVVLGAAGLGSAALTIAMPLALFFLAAFYASLEASISGCIAFDQDQAPTA